MDRLCDGTTQPPKLLGNEPEDAGGPVGDDTPAAARMTQAERFRHELDKTSRAPYGKESEHVAPIDGEIVRDIRAIESPEKT